MPYKDPEKKKTYNRAYRKANCEKLKANHRIYSHDHPEAIKGWNRTYNHRHQEQNKTYQRAYHEALKAEALRVLGGMCACPGCGVSEPAFLTIDHIHGRLIGQRHNPLKEARASGWDKTKFQILCWNCNMSKSDRGFCPVHQKDPGQRNGHIPEAKAQQALWHV